MVESHSNSTAPELVIGYGGYDHDDSDTISTIKDLADGVSFFEVGASWLFGSLQGSSSSGDSQPSLYLSNCALTASDYLSGTEGNCSTICSDPTTSMLPWNMETCYSLGVAAMLVRNGSLAFNSTGENNAPELRCGNLSEWDGEKVISGFVSCISSSCTMSNISHCDQDTVALDGISVTAGNLYMIQAGMKQFCSYGVEINADIAGPGVMISYLLQICAVIFLWVLFNILTKWTWIILSPIFLHLKKRDLDGTRLDPFLSDAPSEKKPSLAKQAWIRASEIQRRLSQRRLYQATLVILREFQEVQVFFIGAIQIATLATFKPKSSSLSDANSANSFGAAIMDSELVQMLAVNSMIPILLVQSMIQRGNRYEVRKGDKKRKRSPLTWYNFTLVWITVILAIIIHARRNKLIANYEDLFEVFKDQKSVPACGGNPNPMVYCNVDNKLDTRFKAGIPVIWLAISLLTIEFLAFQFPDWKRWQPVQRKQDNMNPTQAQVFHWFRKCHWLVVIKAIWFLLECALLASSAIYLADILAITHSMTGGSNSWGATNSWGSWSFGQLIAVMVWVPTIFKFFFYLKFGVEDNDDTREAQKNDDGSAEHTFVELDPLQGAHVGGETGHKAKFWAGSRDSLRKGTPDTGEYGYVRTVSLS